MERKYGYFLISMIVFASTNSVVSVFDVDQHTDISDIQIMDVSSNFIENEIDYPSIGLSDALDQQSMDADKVKRIGDSDEELAQSFKPTYPLLTRVLLRLKSTGNAEYQYYYVYIKQSLLGPTLASTYINRNILIIGTGLYEFDFPDLSVTPGSTYYIIVRGATSTGDSSSIYWWYGYPNPYANGAAWYESISGWNYLQDGIVYCDYCFQTYGMSGGNNPPNTPSQLSGPSSGGVGVPITYSSSTTDPDSDNVKYHLDVNNDGIFDHSSGFYSSGATYSIQITFNSVGTYYLRLKAEDTHGAQSGWSIPKTVTIEEVGNNPPNIPTTPSGPSTGSVGISYSYTTSSTDPDGDDISYGFDWDGDSIVDEYSGLFSSGATCVMSHTWSYAGTFQVKVKAKDEHNDLSGFSSPLTVTISDANNPPEKPSIPSGPSNGKTGITYSYSSTTSDSDGDNIYYWSDWGDGTNTGWVGPYISETSATEAHAWSSQGTYPVKVKAKDVNGDESIWSDSLSVTIPKQKIFSLLYQIYMKNSDLHPLIKILRGF